MVRIITISREFGSGGRTVGKEVAACLGIPCYDRELIEKVAEETGYAREFVEEESEYAPSANDLAYMFLARGFDGLSNADRIWIEQRKIIEKLANDGPCVIVGRCADYILKDRKDVINVFIHADKESRKSRAINEYNIDPNKVEGYLNKIDKKRSTYYNYYTGEKWGSSKNYHLCLDSGLLGEEGCVHMIEAFIKEISNKK